MNLASLRMMLHAQLDRSERSFRDIVQSHSTTDKSVQRHRLEGVLSDAWQAYCGFVRHLLIKSACGSVTESGVLLPPSITPATWERVSYIGVRAAGGNVVQPALLNTSLRKEPTWGDSTKITDIVNALAPANAIALKGNLAGGLTGPKHCQIIRNACAHKNLQTRSEVMALASSYIAATIKHPAESMLWLLPSNSEFAFVSWLDDMRLISEGAVK